MTTQIKFRATLGATKIAPQKGDAGSWGHTPGAFEVTLRVEQPKITAHPPQRERSDYVGNANSPIRFDASVDPGPPPAKPEKAEGSKLAKYERDIQVHEHKATTHAAYMDRLAEYEAEMASYQPQMLAWAQLVGLSALFGAKPVIVTLSPADTGLLPGFTLDALALPASAVAAPAPDPVSLEDLGANLDNYSAEPAAPAQDAHLDEETEPELAEATA